MIVTIDECGDPGFQLSGDSSRYFIIALVIFADSEKAAQVDGAIEQLRRDLGIKPEFKFCKDSPRVKNCFFSKMQEYDFKIEAIIVDKEEIKSEYLREHSRSFYNFILKQLISKSTICNENAKIILDGKGNRHFVQELKTYLRKAGGVKMKSFSLKDSKKDNLVQLADMVVGSLMFKLRHSNDCYTKMLADKIGNIQKFR